MLYIDHCRHEVININIKDKPEWFLELAPLGKVPALELPDGRILYESDVICDYLDEAYPEQRIVPDDPFTRAELRIQRAPWSDVRQQYDMHDFCHFNTLWPRLNGCHLPDDIFECIYLNENVRILIKISLKFVPEGPISNIPALVQIMAWRRPGGKPLSEAMMVTLLTHICVTRHRWVNTAYSKELKKDVPPPALGVEVWDVFCEFIMWKTFLFHF